MENDDVKPQSQIVIGQDLAFISIEELNQRIQLLEMEIARIKADIENKTSSRAKAEQIFKI